MTELVHQKLGQLQARLEQVKKAHEQVAKINHRICGVAIALLFAISIWFFVTNTWGLYYVLTCAALLIGAATLSNHTEEAIFKKADTSKYDQFVDCDLRPIDKSDCKYLNQVALNYPEVFDFLKKIAEEGRLATQYELSQIRYYEVRYISKESAQDEERSNEMECKKLHALLSNDAPMTSANA
jgi:hypothetical protein